MVKYHQGKFIPKNPEKYVGDVNNITFRSSWERKLFLFLDTNPGILKWNSEETIIPYISPIDSKPHRYFVDVTVLYKTRDGEIKRALVEVKPESQTKLPSQKKKTKGYYNDMETYLVNQAKWDAAKKWCDNNKMEFMLITEAHLFGKK